MFSVRWTKAALGELAKLWIDSDATERPDITAATDHVDEVLSSDPAVVGESRAGDRRIAFVPPLVFVFSLDPQDRVVRVLHVWRYGHR